MRTAWIAVLAGALLASACGKSMPSSQSDGAAENPESGQGRAIEAGRALVGKPAPAAVLKTIDGESIDLGSNYGKRPVYLKFWATWCIPCREQMPGFEADFRKYGDRILTVAVNTGFNDSLDAVRRYRSQHRIGMPIAIDDGTLGQALNLRVTPQHVVIGRSGKILFVGHEDDARLDAALERAIAEAPASSGRVLAEKPRELLVGDAVPALGTSLNAAAGFPVGGPAPGLPARALMFFSPWCETYLAESRPEQAANCARVRRQVNQLAKDDGIRLVGISSGLWATPKDLNEFRASGALRIPLYLDEDGTLFRSFGVHGVPTLILLDSNGRITRRIGSADNLDLQAAAAGARASE